MIYRCFLRKICNQLYRESRRSLSSKPSGEKLRVAVVGGGCAGLASALHLAPLVEKGLVASPIDVFNASSNGDRQGRDIGVGIWSTALDPFLLEQDRTSHQMVYDQMTGAGSWLGEVGYRTPDGSWLMKSHLPSIHTIENDMPALLFVRERDMLKSLQTAVHWEEQQGMIRMHHNARVMQLDERSSHPWSAQLEFASPGSPQPSLSERDYHLVIAADGTRSMLRKQYGGHEFQQRTRLTGTMALPNPVNPPSSPIQGTKSSNAAQWGEAQQQVGIGLQDRDYTVFRGNAPLTCKQLGSDGVSFQTWGTGGSMRFATVPMEFPVGTSTEERQVWFITINDKAIDTEPDAHRRRDALLDRFQSWHDPIRQIVLATDPASILMDRAVAHRYATSPVLNFNSVVKKMRGFRPPNSGDGPCIIFVGDAYMTVDPILAQGFTVAMEGAYAMRRAVEKACEVETNQGNKIDRNLEFDPYALQEMLEKRHRARMDRLICLLRATELVQALGQPAGHSITGKFQTGILRPFVQAIPNFIKAPIFNRVLKYSLGVSPFHNSDVALKR